MRRNEAIEMPHPRRHWIPLEDWADYLDLPPEGISEMTLRRLTVMAKNLADKLDEVLSEIEKRMEEGKH
jgi:hypothetical protein